jgi:hypothetical protein
MLPLQPPILLWPPFWTKLFKVIGSARIARLLIGNRNLPFPTLASARIYYKKIYISFGLMLYDI